MLEAARYLLDEWPKEASGRDTHHAALVGCLAVLEGEEPDVSVARGAFEEAAEEAGILVIGR